MGSIYKLVMLISVLILQSCDSDDCTRIDTFSGTGPLPDRRVEVPCDTPEPEPLREIGTIN